MAMWREVHGCASVHKVFAMSVPQIFGLFSSVVGEGCHAASTEWASLHPRVTGIFADAMVGGSLHELLFLKTILETYTAFHLGACVRLRFRSSRVIYLRNIPWNNTSSRVTNGISNFQNSFFSVWFFYEEYTAWCNSLFFLIYFFSIRSLRSGLSELHIFQVAD